MRLFPAAWRNLAGLRRGARCRRLAVDGQVPCQPALKAGGSMTWKGGREPGGTGSDPAGPDSGGRASPIDDTDREKNQKALIFLFIRLFPISDARGLTGHRRGAVPRPRDAGR